MCPTETYPLCTTLSELRPQLMTDCELLRFAQMARLAISSSVELGDPPPAAAVAAFAEARVEWKKRFPALPLSESL